MRSIGCDKVVNSLVNLKSNPPSLHAWFCWRSMDRKDVNENLTKEDGVFVIRTSSQPGMWWWVVVGGGCETDAV
jgi:hypothetical protein